VSDTTQTPVERYGDRLFGSARLDEFRRLDSLARAFNPASRTHLSGLVLPANARCLDVGAGTGDVARILADLVPDGEVVALDRDTAFLHELGQPNLTVLGGDITSPDLDPGQFDLVHARFVLMHVRDRETLLPRLLQWVRPGGWLVLSDAVDLGATYTANDAYRATLVGLYQAIAATIGSDINFGRRYPQILIENGLVNIGVAADIPPVHAGSPLAEFWQLTLGQARSRIIATGLSDDERFDACMNYLEGPTTWDFSLGMISAWGQRALSEARHRPHAASASIDRSGLSPTGRSTLAGGLVRGERNVARRVVELEARRVAAGDGTAEPDRVVGTADERLARDRIARGEVDQLGR